MDRRSFLSLIPAVAVLPFLGQVSARLPTMSLVQRKRLGPNAREVVFADIDQKAMPGPFQLRSKGNAMWIESVSWVDRNGMLHSEMIRKNLPLERSMAFPAIIHASKITFAVTCLPLASPTTLVELAG